MYNTQVQDDQQIQIMPIVIFFIAFRAHIKILFIEDSLSF